MRIKELTTQTGVTAKTIRYYESIGLLPPPRRLDNGYRDYDADDVSRLKLVRGARQIGLSIDDIREILALRDHGEAPCQTLLDLLAAKTREIEERIRTLQNLKKDLETLYALGSTYPKDDIQGKACICHLVSERTL